MGIPGLRGTDHIGFTVPDLEEAHDFLTGVIGATHFYSMGPIRGEDDYMRSQFNVDPDAVIREVRFYRLANGANLEVFEWQPPGEQGPQPRSSDVGGHHIALYVDDFDAALSYLREQGARVLGEPRHSIGPGLGQRWVYFLSPWGMQFELVSYPGGKAYSLVNGQRLWHPADPLG